MTKRSGSCGETRARGWRVRLAAAGWLLALAGWGAAAAPAAAQDPAPAVAVSDALVEVRLHDGSVLFGRVVEVAGARVVLVTEGGARVELDRAQIAGVQPLRGELRDGVVWEADANATRLFFGPTGRTIEAGQGYLGVFELFFPFAAYAPTDRILLSAGTPIIPEIIGEVFYLAPKVRVLSTSLLDLSIGGLALIAAPDVDMNTVGIVFASGTYGEPNRAATLGAGWAFADGELDNKPLFMGGAEQRVSRRVKLMTENYLFLYDEQIYDPTRPDPGEVEPTQQDPIRTETRAAGLISAGVRLLGERLSADLGVGAAVGEDGVCCLPLVNFVYTF